MSWAVQIDILNSSLVVLDDGIKSINSWIENVTIQSEAVGSSVVIWWNSTTKSIKIYLFVGIVELKNAADSLNSLEVLVSVWIEVMQRILLSWVSI